MSNSNYGELTGNEVLIDRGELTGLREHIADQAKQIAALREQLARMPVLEQALTKIAAWTGWGAFPEKKPEYQAMAIMTARAVIPENFIPIDPPAPFQEGRHCSGYSHWQSPFQLGPRLRYTQGT